MKKRFILISLILIVLAVIDVNTLDNNIALYMLIVYLSTFVVNNFKKFEIVKWFNQ
ncbi:MAG: hypothetical protein ACRC6E_07200 [Fusobacteriaceae bacterium]